MELLTEELKKQLPPLYSQENEPDPLVICKFFHPLSHWAWYAYEGSPVNENGYYDADKEKVLLPNYREKRSIVGTGNVFTQKGQPQWLP